MGLQLKRVLIPESVDSCCEKILNAAGVEVVTKLGLTKDQLLQEIKNYDGLVVRSATKVTAEVIKAGTNLRIIGRAGVGVDNIDCDAATRQGILVINAPGGNTLSAAELTCGMVVSLSRNIPGATASLKSGKWDRKSFMGSELLNKTLAIIGLGRIGREVAQRMQSFGMTTIGFDPLVPAEASLEFGVESLPLESIWPRADYITVHTPLIPQTKNLINDEVLKKCKKGVKLVNCARGGIIDEDAVVRALESGQCGGIGFDVFLEEPPKNVALIQHPKTICTPHLGASTVEAQNRVAEEIALQFKDLMEGKFAPGIVNSSAFCQALSEDNKHWVSLCQSLGTVLGSLMSSTNTSFNVSVTLQGNNTNVKDNALKVATTVGLLKHLGHGDANFINAPVLAKEANIEVSSGTCAREGNFPSSVTIMLKSQDECHCAVGKLNGTHPVLCAIDGAGFESPVSLTGSLLLCKGQAESDMLINVLNAFHGAISSAFVSSVFQNSVWCAIKGVNEVPDALKQQLEFCSLLAL